MTETYCEALEARARDLERTASELRALAAELRLAAAPRPVPGLLSVREAAEHAGLSEWAVRRLVATGTVAEVRIGARRLVKTASLDAYVRREGAEVS